MRNLIKNRTVQDGLAVFALGAAFGIYSVTKFIELQSKTLWIMSPYLFPMLLAVFALILAVAMVLEGVAQARKQPPAEAAEASKPVRVLDIVVVIALSIGYDYLMRAISFIPATIAYLGVMIWFLGERRWKVLLPVAILMPLALYAIFRLGLNVRLP